jgi:hypothetical protein
MRTDRPVFIYSMTPRDRTAYKQFFEPGDLKKIIEDPGQIRNAGWDLTTGERARIVNGEYLEVASAERKRIRVYDDGSVLVRVSGDEDYLSWGQNADTFDQAPRLNTLSLIEFTLNFCKLCSRLVVLMEPRPREVDLKVEIKNAFFGQSKLFLIPHPVSSWGYTMTQYRHYAPEASMARKISVVTDDLRTSPNLAAYKLLQQIFYWFRVERDEIPYTSPSPNGSRFVDENLIINSRPS